MGQEAEQNQRAANLAPYQLNRPLLDLADPARFTCTACPPIAAKKSAPNSWMPLIPSSGRRRKTGFMRRKR